MLERLVYRSRAAGEIGSLSLFNLLTQARKRNAQLDITGHLIFDGEYFTQWIEGAIRRSGCPVAIAPEG